MKGSVIGDLIPDSRNGHYFFIRDEDGNDRFAHAKDVRFPIGEIAENLRVEFDPVVRKGGPGNGLRATNVYRCDD